MLSLIIRLIVGGIMGWLASLGFRTDAQSRWLWVITAVVGGMVVSSLMLSSLPGASVIVPVVSGPLVAITLLLGALVCQPVAKPHRGLTRR